MQNQEWPCTAEEITHLRDDQGMAWKQVAIELGLGKGKKNRGRYARYAYRDLTGTHWSESRPKGVRSNGRSRGTRTPVDPSTSRSGVQWDDDTDQEEIEQALLGQEVVKANGAVYWKPKRLLVRREAYGRYYNVEMLCRYATAFTFGPEGDQPLQVEIVEQVGTGENAGTQIRTLFVHRILRVT